MFPQWIENILQGMGVAGAIIFVLMVTVGGLVAYIRSMQATANKVYGYRLQERDTLNKAVTDSSSVLQNLLKSQEERNDLTEEQADLIAKQSQAFELLKVTILSQYDNIKDHNNVSAQAVSSMSEAIRTLSGIVVENRVIATGHVQVVQQEMARQGEEMRNLVRKCADDVKNEMRNLLGNVTRVEHRRKKNVP